MTSLCEFDLLAVLATVAASGLTTPAVLHANFAGWYSERTDPVVVELLDTDSEPRQAIFPKEDKELADTLAALANYAMRAGPGFGVPWDGFEDKRIIEFLREHGAFG